MDGDHFNRRYSGRYDRWHYCKKYLISRGADMKKIMIYTKHRRDFGEFKMSILSNADVFLFFTVFFCGITIGCAMFYSNNIQNIAAQTAYSVYGYGFGNMLGVHIIFILMLFVLGMIGACSAIGILLLITLPLLYGYFTAIISSYMLYYTDNGFGRFALTVLPGAVLIITGLIMFCSDGATLSKITAEYLFFGHKDEQNIKKYFLKTGVCILMCLGGIALQHISVNAFSSLFI